MALMRRLWFLLTKRRREDELAEELEFHRQMKADELRAGGHAVEDLDTSVQRALGKDLLARERSRDVWVAPWFQDITQDLKFGVRMLAADRRFTLAAVIALGLGIGVNNSVFTIMNAAIFRSLPFDAADQLIEAGLTDSRGGFFSPVAYADYMDWSRSAKSFEGLMANSGGTMNLSENGRPAERMRGAYITANTLPLLRVTPFLGRGFVADDERPGAPGTVLISYDLWQGRYGGEPAMLGTLVRINSVPATIIGVMPPGFTYPLAQMWQPISLAPNFNASDRATRNVNVSGRLAAGVDLVQARSELETIAGQVAQVHPDSHKDLRLRFAPMGDDRAGGRQGWVILGTLMGAVTLVLLIACANVASLLLARSAHRSREIAVRASLGASQWRIIRQLLIECVLIAGAAAVVGLWLSRIFSSQMAQAFNVMEIANPGATMRPYWVDISVDAVTLTFVGFVALMVSMLVGLMPAWHLSRTNANDVLKEGGRAGGTVRARRMTGGLLIAQLALTVMLLVQTGLLARSYFRLYLMDLGLDTTGVVTMRIVLPVPKYAGVERQRQFMTTLHDRLSAQAIFSAVALGSDIPLHPLGFGSRSMAIDGQPWPAGEQPPSVFYVTVGPGYLETLRLPVLRGRGLTSLDGLPGQEGVVVNQRFAAKFFPDGNAIGKRVRLTGQNFKPELAPWYTIVGIAPALPNFLPERGDEPVVYIPTQADPGPQRAISIIVRTADPYLGKAAAAAALRDEVSAIDLDLPVFGIQTLDEAAAIARYPRLMVGSWFLVISGTALILAIVGLYALTAHGVAQRAQEIGVRMALGAQAGQVVWLFVRRTVIQLAIGLTLGIGGAVAAGRALSVLVRDANPRDPLTIGIVSGLLIIVALTASIWPARRAARIDPAVVLRSD